jgi:hypothetical protein
MGYNLMSCRLTTRAARHGLFKLLLTLMLGIASLPALSSRHSNVTPVISGTPPTSVVAGNRYDFRPSATDANGDRLTFYISNQPAWASFSSRTGELSGTPTSDSVGVYGNIVISVSDRRSSASLPPFGIQVVAVSAGAGDGVSTSDGTSSTSTSSGGTGSGGTPVSNTAPVISGTPDTSVVANSAYSFQPTATDADGDTLTFSITNKPSWASFSSSTGKLNGTPATSGSSSNIVISVSDGQASASLPAFSITVQAAVVQTGSMSLQWTAPVTRSDGTPLSLSDIDGYRIYYGASAGNYPNRIDVADSTAQSVTVTDMPAGTQYVVMTTYDVNGLESAYSSMVTKNVK